MNRLSPIFQSSSHLAVANEIDRLTDLYLYTQRKALPVELLFAAWGEAKRPIYGITLCWENEDEMAAEWVKENVLKD